MRILGHFEKLRMNKTISKPLFTVLLMSGVLFLNPFSVLAQEGSPGHGLGDYNHTDNNYDHGTHPTDGIGEPINEVMTPKPETSTAIAKKKVVNAVAPKKEEVKSQTTAPKTVDSNTESANKGENNESVLGFNVLYYMIQKFKFNDVNVIDQ